MTQLSPGIVQGCAEMLRLLAANPCPRALIRSSFFEFSGVQSSLVIEAADRIGWLATDESGHAIPSPKGMRFIGSASYELLLRQAILDHVDTFSPAWLQNATAGRARVLAFSGQGVAQTFVEAGLAGALDEDGVSFWDSLAARARGERDSRLTEIGRRGERLSLEYERARTGHDAKWIAINSNADGYDLLSVVSSTDSRSLSVEVKASSQGLDGRFFVSRNEWETAVDRPRHIFHLWDVAAVPARLAVVEVSEMAANVASDQGYGEWQSLAVPFAAFASRFSVPEP